MILHVDAEGLRADGEPGCHLEDGTRGVVGRGCAGATGGAVPVRGAVAETTRWIR